MTRDTDRLLREATSGLVRAVRALEDAGEHAIAVDAFTLANRVLHARQALRAATTPAASPAAVASVEPRR